jgi:hypothetical protein
VVAVLVGLAAAFVADQAAAVATAGLAEAALPADVVPGPEDIPDQIARRELGRPDPVRSGGDDQGLS